MTYGWFESDFLNFYFFNFFKLEKIVVETVKRKIVSDLKQCMTDIKKEKI